jgi:hypothetical protein
MYHFHTPEAGRISNGKKIIFIVMVNHVVKFGKDPIYRTKVIVRKPVWTPTHHTQSHNMDSLETGV